MTRKKFVVHPYPLKKIMVVNGWKFTEILISSHYKENHPYMTDEIILEIAKQLDKKNNFIPHREGKLPVQIKYQNNKSKVNI